MKKAFKIIGIILGSILGLLGIATAVAAIGGAFSNKKIDITELSWETDKVRVVDDYKTTINFLPENANQLDVELKLVYADGANIVEIPSTVKAGQEFTIKLKKDANGNNIGGEVVIEAKTKLVVSKTKLKILVDVPIPNNGLVLASDFDSEDDDKLINAGSSQFGLYVYTNPNLALNSNTGKETDLIESYKDITIKSGNESALQIVTAGTQKEGFYCPDYIEHGHKGPFKDNNGNYLGSTCQGRRLEKRKFVEYTAKAITSTKESVIITAKALRTYSMQEEYVDKNDSKYLDENNKFEGEPRQNFFTDLSNYISNYQDYIKADTREFYDPLDETHTQKLYDNGQAFIDSVTYTNQDGEKYIKINDNRIDEEAAYFYMYVESRTIFNIKEIEISEVKSSITDKVEFEPHGALQQFDVTELKNKFQLSLIPSNDEEFDSDDLAYRLTELRVLSIMNKQEGSTSPYEFDTSDIFEIENPSSTTNPIWSIRCINPITNANRSRNYRLRFYIPTSKTKTDLDFYTTGDKYVDIGVEALENGVQELRLYTTRDTGANALNTTMIINKQDIEGYSYRQLLDSTRYLLTGANNKQPTYSLVKFFVTEESAKTKYNNADTTYFKAKLEADGVTPTLKSMPYNTTQIKAYELNYYVANQLTLEAINITNGDPLKVFAAVVKTDYKGNPIDTNGVSYGEEGYNGIYQIIARSTNDISIVVNNYLESLNFYTLDDADPTTYTLRNITQGGDSSTTDTIQLLADQTYNLKVSPFYLNAKGEFDTANKNYIDNAIIDYKTNLTQAMLNAYNNGYIGNSSFSYDSVDVNVKSEFDPNNVIFNVEVDAKINKNASYNYKPEAFDLKVNASGALRNIFDSSKSTVNMIVNYASIDSFNLTTGTGDDQTGVKDTFTLSPQVVSLDEIKWKEPGVDTQFDLNLDYTFDIQKQDPDGNYNSKIDKYIGTQNYVISYVNMLRNLSNTDVISIDWNITFADGAPSSTAKVSDYIEIINNPTEAEKQNLIAGMLKPIKGETNGVKLKVECIVSIYKTTNGYIDQKSASINIVLIQKPVVFETYSPYGNLTNEHDPNSYLGFVVNGQTLERSLQLEGGKHQDLLLDRPEKNVYVYNSQSGQYEESNAKVRTYIKAILDTDGNIGRFCTYTIDTTTSIGNVPPIYFVDSSGGITYSTRPDEGKLMVYSRYISENTMAKITVTSPFSDTSTEYYITVLSSIKFEVPTENVSVSTTVNDGKLDLSEIYKVKSIKDKTYLPTSFELIGDNTNFASLTSAENASPILTSTGQEIPRTILTAYNVYSDRTVKLKLYYYVLNDEGCYIKNEMTSINGNELSVIIKPGYSAALQSGITNQDDTKFTLVSGKEANFFDNDSYVNKEFSTSTSSITNDFIKIKNINTDSNLNAIDTSNIIGSLLQLAYDTEKLGDDQAIFETLFSSTAQKNLISSGIFSTRSIPNNLTVPIKVLFKEGNPENPVVQEIGVFWCKVTASVTFSISDAPNESARSNDTQSFKNYNYTLDSSDTVTLEAYTIYLFNINERNNILSLKGADGNELLSSLFTAYTLYRYENGVAYPVENDDNVEVIANINNGILESLILNIKNSVNESVLYKLSIATSINKPGETYDYQFRLDPSYILTVNYPLGDTASNEVVRVGTQIDLLSNYINQNVRIQAYDDREGENFNIVATTEANKYRLVFTNSTKTVTLKDGMLPISFSIVSGTTGKITNNILQIVSSPVNATEDLTVRATLFNGAYIDYVFEVYKDLSVIEANVPNEVITMYGDTNYNLLDYLSLGLVPPDGFKYVVKYNYTQGLPQCYFNGMPVNDSNKILSYTGSNLIINFEDIVDTNGINVSFSVWTNYSVSGEDPKQLNIKLYPNLKLKENTNITTLVSGRQAIDILTISDTWQNPTDNDTWLVSGNDSLSGISVSITKVVSGDMVWASNTTGTNNSGIGYIADESKYRIMVDPTETDVSKQVYLDMYVIKNGNVIQFYSNNVGKNYVLTFAVSREAFNTKYELTYDIVLVPDINLNSSYIGSTAYVITAATGAEITKTILLNNYDTNLFNPTDYDGNSLNEEFTATNPRITTSADTCTVDGVHKDYTFINTVGGDGKLTLTIGAINKEENVFVKYTITWQGGTESYEAIIRLTVKPNIYNESVEYIGKSTSELVVYAGSEAELTFNNGLIVKQSNNSAQVKGEQQRENKDITYANVILKLDEGGSEDLYYTLINDDTNPRIKFMSVPQTTTIEIPYYYDLSGKKSGLYYSSNSSSTENKLDFETEAYNPNKSIKIKIMPVLDTIAFKDNNSVGTTESNPIDIANQFAKDLYKDDGLSKSSSEFNYETDLTTTPSVGLHGYNIINLFNIATESEATFDSTDTSKIVIDRDEVIKGIIYNVTISMGKKGSTFSVVERPQNYYTLSADNTTIYFIPQMSVTYDTIKATIQVQLPGKTGATSNRTIYVEFQYSGTYKYNNEDITEGVGKSGEIIDTEKMFEISGLTFNAAVYDSDLSLVPDNAITSDKVYNLDELFRFGYLIREKTTTGAETGVVDKSYTVDGNNNLPDSSEYNPDTAKNVTYLSIITRNIDSKSQNVRYYYLPSNIKLTYTIKSGLDYASIINGNQLQINPYYCTSSNDIGTDGNRKITITISCGGFSTDREISIFPIKVRYTFRAIQSNSTYTFEPQLVNTKTGESVQPKSSVILLNKEKNIGVSDLDTILTWLNNDKFTPMTEKLLKDETLVFTNSIVFGEGASMQEFEKDCTISLVADVGLQQNSSKLSISPNLSGTERNETFIDETGNGLFISKVFTNNVKLDNLNVALTFNDFALAKEYISSVGGNDLSTLTDGSIINITKDQKTIYFKSREVSKDVKIIMNLHITATETIGEGDDKITKDIDLSQSFTLTISCNIGVSGLMETYNVTYDLDDYGDITDQITILFDNGTGTNHFSAVTITGNGTISARIMLADLGVTGNFNGTEDALNDAVTRMIKCPATGESRSLTGITINSSGLKGTAGTTIKLRTFKLKLMLGDNELKTVEFKVTNAQ